MGSMTSPHHLARMALILTVLKMVRLDLLTLVVRNAQFFLGGKGGEENRKVCELCEPTTTKYDYWVIDWSIGWWMDWLTDGWIDWWWMDDDSWSIPVFVACRSIHHDNHQQKKPPKKRERLVDLVRGWHHLFPVKSMRWPPKWKSRVFN